MWALLGVAVVFKYGNVAPLDSFPRNYVVIYQRGRKYRLNRASEELLRSHIFGHTTKLDRDTGFRVVIVPVRQGEAGGRVPIPDSLERAGLRRSIWGEALSIGIIDTIIGLCDLPHRC